HAATLLARQYTLVVTNPPFLGQGRMADELKSHANLFHELAKADLSTTVLDRWLAKGGSRTSAFVLPRNGLSLNSYRAFRAELLGSCRWNMMVPLGSGAFSSITGEVVNVALGIFTARTPKHLEFIAGLDGSDAVGEDKAIHLRHARIRRVAQSAIADNPDSRFSFENLVADVVLCDVADAYAGIQTGDYPRFGRCFWELPLPRDGWELQLSTVSPSSIAWGGREHILFWENGEGELLDFVESKLGESGVGAWLRGI